MNEEMEKAVQEIETNVEEVAETEEDVLLSDKYFGHFKEWLENNKLEVEEFSEEHFKQILILELYNDYKALLYQRMQEQAAEEAAQKKSKSKLLVPDHVASEMNKEEEKTEKAKVIQFPGV